MKVEFVTVQPFLDCWRFDVSLDAAFTSTALLEEVGGDMGCSLFKPY